MTDEEMLLRSCKYAVEQMLEKGNCFFFYKNKDETYRIDYAEVHKYLRDRLSELKGEQE